MVILDWTSPLKKGYNDNIDGVWCKILWRREERTRKVKITKFLLIYHVTGIQGRIQDFHLGGGGAKH